MPRKDSFNLFIVAVPQAGLRYAMGVSLKVPFKLFIKAYSLFE